MTLNMQVIVRDLHLEYGQYKDAMTSFSRSFWTLISNSVTSLSQQNSILPHAAEDSLSHWQARRYVEYFIDANMILCVYLHQHPVAPPPQSGGPWGCTDQIKIIKLMQEGVEVWKNVRHLGCRFARGCSLVSKHVGVLTIMAQSGHFDRRGRTYA
jgi:hypothetical protein